MDKIQDKFVNDLTKKGVSPNTVKNYKSQFNSLLDLFNFPDNLNFLTTPEKNIKLIDESYTNPNTKASKINIIMVIIKNFYSGDKKWEDIYKIYEVYRDKIKNELISKQGDISEKQKEKMITPEQTSIIKEFLKSKIKKQFKIKQDIIPLRNYILFTLLNDLKTRGDIVNSKIVLDSKKFTNDIKYNFIIINKSKKTLKYIQNVYKTSKTYDTQEFTITNELYPFFIKLYNAYKKFDITQEWAFYQDNLQEKLNENNLSKIYSSFGESINKQLSIQVNRIADASAPEDRDSILRIKEKAKKQGHSIQMHLDRYFKLDLFMI